MGILRVWGTEEECDTDTKAKSEEETRPRGQRTQKSRESELDGDKCQQEIVDPEQGGPTGAVLLR